MEFKLLEEALNSVAAGPSQRNEIWTFMSESTPIPEAYTNDEHTPKVTMAFHDAKGSGHREGCRYGLSKRSVSMKTLKEGGVSHSECLEFLCTKGPTFMMRSLDDKHEIISLLLMMADNLMTAQASAAAAAEPPAWDMLKMSMWYVSLCELIKEMKMVQEQYPSVIDNSGVYVVSSAPYHAFLRALAAEVADRCG